MYGYVSQALENEIAAHEGQVREVMKEASALMMASQHGGAGIREKNSELRKAWTELQNLASGRRHMLNDAMEAQKVRGVPHYLGLPANIYVYQLRRTLRSFCSATSPSHFILFTMCYN